MFLSRLHLRNYRNFAEQVVEFPPQGAALVGDNGQGKTNLLEAIYYLEIFRSFRGAPDEQLVRFGEEVFRAEARLSDGLGGDRTVSAAFDRRARKKKVALNGAEPERLGDALGQVGAVIFSPSDVEIVAGGPGGRRRFLDIVLSLAQPGYLSAVQRYRQALFQRNTLLRKGSSRALVEVWDAGLVLAGSRVIAARQRWVAARADSFAAHYERVAGGQPGRLGYAPSAPEMAEAQGEAQVQEAFRGALARAADREQRRGMTLVGPHRDDLRFTTLSADGAVLELRTYGSGGQQRTGAIALRMVEAETIHEARGRQPLILLDDVFAELDPGRSQRIIDWIETEDGGQVILTSPKPTDFHVRGDTLPRWGIRDGVILQD
ncbi:DNA replication/repair protein RecF [Longimicrobium terrae]|uniref:DNA replication and repair protein RecF n=1 Tax=Longimicrobium terrae TaxID=1639882 RepID=A0A841GYX7_9BACT|nr:DNA replication/repair protein RecF [Longimicrobium terrae]MBB4636485.1 DNA replication and repair protein RecF [Longimicrobium terrae]MBB6070991.1 DNA replication and repair protein RecF [Longimicrobium terrae]NNC29013.1 DNA replication/repair protein RecF [Longimicrobium terrae]